MEKQKSKREMKLSFYNSTSSDNETFMVVSVTFVAEIK